MSDCRGLADGRYGVDSGYALVDTPVIAPATTMSSEGKFITIPRDPHSWLPPYPQRQVPVNYAAETEKIEAAARNAGLDVVYGENLFDADGRDPVNALNWMPLWSTDGYDWDQARWTDHFIADKVEPLPLP